MFAKHDDKTLRGYVVWQPMLGGKEQHVEDATRLVPDERAVQFWDGHGATVRGFRRTLDLPEPAWDIYMVYGADARWTGDTPPVPAYWEHQLGTASRPRVHGPYLDPERFAAKTAALLDRP